MMEISNSQYQAAIDSSYDHHLEEVLGFCPKLQLQNHEQHQQAEKKLKPNPDQAPKCPRCDSTNTKFCYYNNYSLSQPRYFCKGCRRYWTHGGTLRNIPVGGSCRKTKKSSSSSSSKRSHDHQNYQNVPANNPSTDPNNASGFLDVLRNGFLESTTTGSNSDLNCFQNLWYGFDNQEELKSGLAAVKSPLNVTVTQEAVNSSHGSAIEVDGERKNTIEGADFQCDGIRFVDVDSSSPFSSWQELINSSQLM